MRPALDELELRQAMVMRLAGMKAVKALNPSRALIFQRPFLEGRDAVQRWACCGRPRRLPRATPPVFHPWLALSNSSTKILRQ